MLNTSIRHPQPRTVMAAKKPTAAPKKTEPQNLEDVIAEHEHSVERIDTHIKQLGDPQWLADRKAKLEKQRATAQHEVDILRQVAPATKGS